MDYVTLKVNKTELINASETLAELLSKKGSTQEAKEVRDNAAAIQQEIVKFKFQHRATLGTVSRASSVASSRRSNKSSSIHSSASSAEKGRIAAADSAALKARLEYDKQAAEMDNEAARIEMDSELKKREIEEGLKDAESSKRSEQLKESCSKVLKHIESLEENYSYRKEFLFYCCRDQI